jgi:hypothetical protein
MDTAMVTTAMDMAIMATTSVHGMFRNSRTMDSYRMRILSE